MKIKRFTAPDMRAAIRLVREEQGPDAVILSSNKVAGGVEIIAATDYDEALVQQAARVTGTGNNQAERPQRRQAPEQQAQAAQQPRTAIETAAPAQPREKPAKKIVWAQDPAIAKLQRDLNNLRYSIEGQLRSLNYDLQAATPEHTEALRTLTGLGLDVQVARTLVSSIERSTPAKQVRSQALVRLAQTLPVSLNDSILKGGHIALIGPTGVGKTTTIAKLAAYYAMSRSSRDIALVTTDHYRIGAQEQLFIYGRMLGVPVHALQPRQSLSELLEKLSDYHLVLIDTAGMSPRDPRLSEQLAALNLGDNIKNYLVMPASGQAQDLEEMAARFSDVPLSGCILTKLDETTRLGGAMSVAIRRKLNIDYLCDGQRVPEDLHRCKPNELVVRAMRAAGGDLPPRPSEQARGPDQAQSAPHHNQNPSETHHAYV